MSNQEQLAMYLRLHLFAANIDESTDYGGEKTLAITVFYPDFNQRKYKGILFDLPLVFERGQDASSAASVLFGRS